MSINPIRTTGVAAAPAQPQPQAMSGRLRRLLLSAKSVDVAAPAGHARTDALFRRTAGAFAAAAGLSMALLHGHAAWAQGAPVLGAPTSQAQLSPEDAALGMAQSQLGLGMGVRRTFNPAAPIGAYYELGGTSCRVNLYDRYWESPEVRHLAQVAGWDDQDARAFVSAHEAQHCVTGFHAAGTSGRDRAQAYAEVLFGGQSALRQLASRLQLNEPLTRVASLRTNAVSARMEALSDLVGLAALQRSRAERGLPGMTPGQVEALADARSGEPSHDTSAVLRILAEDMRHTDATFPVGVSNTRTIVDYAVDTVLGLLGPHETDRIERQALVSAITQISGVVSQRDAGGAAAVAPDKALSAAVDVLQDNLQRNSASTLDEPEARLTSAELVILRVQDYGTSSIATCFIKASDVVELLAYPRCELQGASRKLDPAATGQVTPEVLRLQQRLRQMAQMIQARSESAGTVCGQEANDSSPPDCSRERMR